MGAVQPRFLTSDNIQLPESTHTPAEVVSTPRLADILEAALASSTRRAYRNDLRHFLNWGGMVPASPEVLARYLAEHAESLSIATLSRRIVAIGKAHTLQGYANPAVSDLVKLTLRGIRRTYGKPQQQAAAAIRDDIFAMVAGLEATPKALRDKALLLIGFAGAFRRSELCAINCTSVERVAHGFVITLPRSKTDQEGKGRKVGIPLARGPVCPVKSLEAWLEMSGITEGPVFRPVDRHGRIGQSALSGEAVAVIIKERAKAAGLDPTRYSGHSLRAGLATSAAMAGVPAWKIRQQTGHASDTMLARYIRDGELFRENAASSLL